MVSKRNYEVIGFNGGEGMVNRTFSLERLIKSEENDFEIVYALQEEIDLILDLEVGQTMFVNISRDDVNCKGVLMRVS